MLHFFLSISTATYMYVPAPVALSSTQKQHEVVVELHDHNIDCVDQQQNQHLIPFQFPVPGKPDKQGNGQAIDHRVSDQRSPVQVQRCSRQDGTQGNDDENVEHGTAV